MFFKAIFSKTFGPQLEILNYIFVLFLEDSRFRIGQTFAVLQNFNNNAQIHLCHVFSLLFSLFFVAKIRIP